MRKLPQAKSMKRADKLSSLLEESFMNEKAYDVILTWLEGFDESYIDFDNLTEQEHEEVIFTKWAIEEILQLVWDHPWTLASETVLRFGLEMTECVAKAATDEQRRMFQIALNTAWELLESVEEVEK